MIPQPLTNAEALVPLLRRSTKAVYDDVDNKVRRDAREQHCIAHALASLAGVEAQTFALLRASRRSR